MTAMTPMKCFLIDHLEIYTEDMTGQRELVATAPDEIKRDWLISSLREFHKQTPLVTIDGKALAPFTDSQIIALNKNQRSQNNHPYTCDNNHAFPRSLVPTRLGWRCSVTICNYTQNWAHAIHTGVV